MKAELKLDDLISKLVGRAFSDYAGARCCFLNICVVSGYLLAQQAAEKLLKAIAYSGAGKKIVPPRGKSHDLAFWKAAALETLPWIAQLDEYVDLLDRLTDAFEGKYPDSIVGTETQTSAELLALDKLIKLLLINAPSPSAFFAPFMLARISLVSPEMIVDPAGIWVAANNQPFLEAAETLSDTIGCDLLLGVKISAATAIHVGYNESTGPTLTYGKRQANHVT